MPLTTKQEAAIIEHLEQASTLAEAAALAEVPPGVFAKAWSESQATHEATGESTFYSRCQKARAACRSTLRSMAAEDAGNRAASDRLALLARLEAEEDPRDTSADDDPYAHLWGSALPEDLWEAVEQLIAAYPVDADALVNGQGSWSRAGADAAASDHAGRRIHVA